MISTKGRGRNIHTTTAVVAVRNKRESNWKGPIIETYYIEIDKPVTFFYNVMPSKQNAVGRDAF